MANSGRGKNLVGPLALLSLFLLVLLGLASAAMIGSFDRQATERERELVNNGIEGRISEVGGMVLPQVVWADAVRNLDNRFDPRWAKINILSFLADTDDFDTIFVIDAANRPLIGQRDGRPAGRSDILALSAKAAGLIAQIRAAEDRRLERNHGDFRILDRAPIQAKALASIGGEDYILTATRVQPDFTDSWLRGPHGPIVLAAMKIDAPFLSAFARRYLLKDLTLSKDTASLAPGFAVAPLVDARGELIGALSWRPQNPAATLFRTMAPGLGLLGLILLILAIRLIRQSHRDARGLIASEARAAHLAYHDLPTGLANRVQFNDQLSKALARRRRGGEAVTVMCLDLDRFKDINDAFGHGVGDALLKEAAQRMATQCRASDLLARLSGDEFAIIALGASPTEAVTLAERLIEAVCSPFSSGSTLLHIGCSIGIAMADRAAVDPAEILRQADIALYRAKDSGRGGYRFFEAEMDVATKSRAAITADLRDAIARGELTLVYQPQSDAGGRITGLEALLRWNHPVRGEVGPGHFIPIAEQSGLITDLGHFALRQAFVNSRRWPQLTVAINISASQIRDRAFISELAKLVDEHQVDPARFDLEITEGILLGDEPEIQERLGELRQMGFGLALDDFGTGYSSLSYLHRYPISKIKIDRSFVANLGVEPQAGAVIDAIVKLARALHLQVVAEGVETAPQFRQLARSGCHAMQGFLLSRPVIADEVADLLTRVRGIPADKARAA